MGSPKMNKKNTSPKLQKQGSKKNNKNRKEKLTLVTEPSFRIQQSLDSSPVARASDREILNNDDAKLEIAEEQILVDKFENKQKGKNLFDRFNAIASRKK